LTGNLVLVAFLLFVLLKYGANEFYVPTSCLGGCIVSTISWAQSITKPKRVRNELLLESLEVLSPPLYYWKVIAPIMQGRLTLI
jgi:hypothetical protein